MTYSCHLCPPTNAQSLYSARPIQFGISKVRIYSAGTSTRDKKLIDLHLLPLVLGPLETLSLKVSRLAGEMPMQRLIIKFVGRSRACSNLKEYVLGEDSK